jgi:hypothetical protein
LALETLDDIVEEIADGLGIYGAHLAELIKAVKGMED